ncbi:CbiX/SirB N-terminal domain-containing protein [Actinoplanes sp. NEAU-A12]|uniref:CbiX/SirB N-terminal domain-containing protein n=1 Tax=Actinoplanes sandaracinus TaxID=3045177 RepID=A0ABT6WM20_9ACTN|nr:CbiX/SirB N-terminal domain-containing protein [Actinoplanes sandaracinus]MDI6100776.1 CbiX/SirB N-terminal domain-containing protein [Actinoplanes sandaracinus]
MTEFPTLIAVAHGTRSPAGRRQIQELAATVARRRPGLDVRLCYVDVQEPKVADIVPTVGDAVVVPLLLSAGYHVRVDIAEAVAGTRFPVTAPLGPDPVFLESLRRNLPATDAIVLASAGSSDPRWVAGIQEVAAQLSGPRGDLRYPLGNGVRGDLEHPLGNGPRVELGYTSGSGPRVADVVARLRAEGARTVAVAAYLLAEGLFYRTLHAAGADHVTPPLCHDAAVADLVLRRFDSAILTTVGSGL